jgi:hypothetical protein
MLEQKTKLRKKCVSYFKRNKTTLKKYLDVDHVLIVKNFEKKMNCNLKSSLERQFTKKRPTIKASAIFKKFGAMDHYKKVKMQ